MIDRWVRPENYGWVMVGASAVIMAFAFGSLISVSVFLKPLEAEFGWARGTTSFAYSSAAFLAGLGGIFMGRLVDRITTRPIVVFGVVMLGAAHLLLAFIGSLWELYAIYGVMVGALANAAFLTPLMTNVGFWFERHKGTAMGIVMAGQSVGAASVPFVNRLLIDAFAWRQAYLVLGLAIWALLVPLALLVREPPGLSAARAASRRDEGLTRPVIPPAALTATLCVAIVFCCICMSIPIIHVYPLALETGVVPAGAASVLTVMMIASIFGRVGVGKVADRVGGPGSLLLSSGGQTAMIFWFTQTGTLPGFLLVAALFGLAYGGVVPSYAIIVRELIPTHRVGSAMGLVFFFGMLGMALGGWLGGALYDWSGGYPMSFGTGALSGMVNLLIVGTLLLYLRGRSSPQPVPRPA